MAHPTLRSAPTAPTLVPSDTAFERLEPGRALLEHGFPPAFDRDPVDGTASSHHRGPFLGPKDRA